MEELIPKHWPGELVLLRWRAFIDQYHFFYVDQIKLVADPGASDSIESGHTGYEAALGQHTTYGLLNEEGFGVLAD